MTEKEYIELADLLHPNCKDISFYFISPISENYLPQVIRF